MLGKLSPEVAQHVQPTSRPPRCPIHHRKDAQPVLYTADDVERYCEDDTNERRGSDRVISLLVHGRRGALPTINTNTSHLSENITMDAINYQQDASIGERLEPERAIIRRSLNEIAQELGKALRDAGLNYPVRLVVPHAGDAVALIAFLLDPPDSKLSQISEILCRIIGGRLGGIVLRSRELPCTIADASVPG
jgi:hypothetical protein